MVFPAYEPPPGVTRRRRGGGGGPRCLTFRGEPDGFWVVLEIAVRSTDQSDGKRSAGSEDSDCVADCSMSVACYISPVGACFVRESVSQQGSLKG